MHLEAPIRGASGGLDTDGHLQAQLEKLLNSKFFKTSRRSSSMLRYIAEHAIQDDTVGLKERTIGIEVFSRPPDYDTSTDPVVRNAAAEIRKRLALYYAENSDDKVRISLPLGSYVAMIETGGPTIVAAPAPPSSPLQEAPIAIEAVLPPAAQAPRRRALTGLWVALIVVAVLGGLGFYRSRPSSLVSTFWSPWVGGQKAVLLCLGNIQGSKVSVEEQDPQDLVNSTLGVGTRDRVGLAEVVAVHSISELMAAHKTDLVVQSASSTNLADMRTHPAILVGGRTNQWTMRIMNSLPLRLFQDSTASRVGIRESATGNVLRLDDLMIPVERRQAAYGLIARVHDPDTGQFTLVLAGLGPNGTIATIQFVTDPAALGHLEPLLQRGWEHGNLELIVEATLIGGEQGAPRIVKVAAW